MPTASAAEVAALARMIRQSTSPGALEALSRMNMQIDIRHVLPAIRVPTLVLHNTRDRWVEVERGRDLARRIPGAAFVDFPIDGHMTPAADLPPVVAEMERFLSDVWETAAVAQEPERVLATVMFTDIVGSTETAAEIGDARWREMLERHHALIRRELLRFRGREVDTAGDGFFASFDGPARAIHCACAIVQTMPELGLQVRAGLHTGECELLDGKVAGIAVHTGARVAAKAQPGEVLVSGTVKDLVAGSGLAFEDRGEHELKASRANGASTPWTAEGLRENAKSVSRRRPPEAPASAGHARKREVEDPAYGGILAYSRSARQAHDRPVTPEVAGSSPVAPVSVYAASTHLTLVRPPEGGKRGDLRGICRRFGRSTTRSSRARMTQMRRATAETRPMTLDEVIKTRMRVLLVALLLALGLALAAGPAAAQDTAGLTLTLTPSTTKVKTGDVVTFTVRVENTGTTTISGLLVQLGLPDALNAQEVVCPGDTHDTVVLCDLGDVAPGSVVEVVFTVEAGERGPTNGPVTAVASSSGMELARAEIPPLKIVGPPRAK
jgi:uncharacterized repeat protein (TIGR01451 family)